MAGECQIEVTSDGEQRVTNQFRLESTTILAPEETVPGVDFSGALVHPSLLLPRGREQDPPVQSLEGPTIGDEIASEAIEKERVAGGPTTESEVRWSLDDSGAEMALPDPVDDDSGGQGVLLVNYPSSKFQSTALLPSEDRCGDAVGDNLEHTPRRHFLRQVQVVPTNVHRQVANLTVGNPERRRDGIGLRFFQKSDLPTHLFERLPHLSRDRLLSEGERFPEGTPWRD